MLQHHCRLVGGDTEEESVGRAGEVRLPGASDQNPAVAFIPDRDDGQPYFAPTNGIGDDLGRVSVAALQVRSEGLADHLQEAGRVKRLRSTNRLKENAVRQTLHTGEDEIHMRQAAQQHFGEAVRNALRPRSAPRRRQHRKGG